MAPSGTCYLYSVVKQRGRVRDGSALFVYYIVNLQGTFLALTVDKVKFTRIPSPMFTPYHHNWNL